MWADKIEYRKERCEENLTVRIFDSVQVLHPQPLSIILGSFRPHISLIYLLKYCKLAFELGGYGVLNFYYSSKEVNWKATLCVILN